MKRIEWVIISTLLTVVIVAIAIFHYHDIAYIGYDDTTVDEQVDQSIEELTVMDVLQIRNELKKSYYEDSVFIHMPEQILTHILIEKGTDLSIPEIVNEYISNLDHYNKIKDAMDKRKNYIKNIED